MKSVINKTHQPLKIHLSQGKVLHLGAHQSGQISFQDADRDGVKKLLEAGQIELVDASGNPAIPSRDAAPGGG